MNRIRGCGWLARIDHGDLRPEQATYVLIKIKELTGRMARASMGYLPMEYSGVMEAPRIIMATF